MDLLYKVQIRLKGFSSSFFIFIVSENKSKVVVVVGTLNILDKIKTKNETEQHITDRTFLVFKCD